MHALYALDGLGALDAGSILLGLQDKDATVRRHGVKLSEKFSKDPQAVSMIAPKLVRLIDDPDAQVRYQLAFTLGEFAFPERPQMLALLARHDAGDKWISAAILSSLTGGAGEVFKSIMDDQTLRTSRAGRELLHQIVVLIGAREQKEDIAAVRKALSQNDNPAVTFSLVLGLGEGLQRHGKSLADLPELKPIFERAGDVAVESRTGNPGQLQAIELLGFCNDKASERRLYDLLAKDFFACPAIGGHHGAGPPQLQSSCSNIA